MRWIFVLLLTFYSHLAGAGVVVAFMGAGGSFDHVAFIRYANSRGLTPVVLQHNSIEVAAAVASQGTVWEVYAYSLGATRVHKLLGKVSNLPRRVVTIGAYRTVNVDFTVYGVPFYNFFDQSGSGQRSPGMHLSGVTHWSIQQAAVERLISRDVALESKYNNLDFHSD